MAGGASTLRGGQQRRSSVVATFQNLVKPFIGAGILALPASFKQGGLLASVLLMALMALMANYCIRCLLHCLQQATEPGYLSPRQTASLKASASSLLSPLVDSSTSSLAHPSLQRMEWAASYSATSPPTFRDIGELAFGAWGKYAVDVSLVASQLGFCTAYVAFIGENMAAVFPSIPSHHWMLLAMTALMLLCQIRQVATIAFTSAIGNAVYLVSIAIIFADGARHGVSAQLSSRWVEWSGLPLVFGTACFALEGIGLILPVKAAMRDADQHRFFSLLNLAVALVASAYIVFGAMGYVLYGDAVVAPVTGNLTPGLASDAVKVSLCVSLFFSYILQLFPVVDISDYAVYCSLRSKEEARLDRERERQQGSGGEAEDAVEDGEAGEQDGDVGAQRPRAEEHNGRGLSIRPELPSGRLGPSSPFASARTPHLSLRMVATQCLVRALWVGLTALVAIVVSNFGFVVSMTGSLANSLIAFILPALFYVRLVVLPQHPQPLADGWRSLRHFLLPVAVVVSGVCASVVGVYSAVSEQLSSKA